jgi:hypothetical protein
MNGYQLAAIPGRAEIFFFSTMSRPALGYTKSLYLVSTGGGEAYFLANNPD